MKKKVLAMLLATAMTCSLAACGSSPSTSSTASDPSSATGESSATDDDYEYPVMTIVVNDYNVQNSGIALGTQLAIDYIEEKSGGNITCDSYYGGTLMESTDSFAGTAEGLADITYYLYTLNSGVCALHTLFTSYYVREMPGMIGMLDCISATLDSVPEFRQEFMNQNLYEIVAIPTGSSRMQFHDADTANKIKTPDDLSGMLVMSSGYNTPAFANHNVSGISMAPSEWYTNLERGVCDALTLNLCACSDFGVTDVVNSYIEFGNNGGIYSSAGAYLANLDAWNSWDPEVQELVSEAFYQGAKYICERDDSMQWDVWDAEAAAGKNMVTIPEEEMQPWYDFGMEALELWKADVNALGVDADAVLDGYLAVIEDWFAANS